MTDSLTEALRAWCVRRYQLAELEHSASRGQARTWDGKPTEWLDHLGTSDRTVMEACMDAGIWEPVFTLTE